ncbi:MAG: PIG-L family deacetylase [Lachnospiraceae bacterium]|nr:PIG-L family deacetylase [Lachnospiraceae bacterium]
MINKALMIGAHYDDVELGCGGTACRLVSEGKKVYKITLTDNGFTDENASYSISKDKTAESSHKICAFAGIEELTVSQSGYGRLAYGDGSLMHELETLIIKREIDTVFMHMSHDMHHDHIAAYDICKTASRHCRNVFMFQSNGYIKDRSFSPSLFVDISAFADKKREMLKIYEDDQKEQNNNGRLFDICLKQNEIWGYGNGCAYAEGFEVLKALL